MNVTRRIIETLIPNSTDFMQWGIAPDRAASAHGYDRIAMWRDRQDQLTVFTWLFCPPISVVESKDATRT